MMPDDREPTTDARGAFAHALVAALPEAALLCTPAGCVLAHNAEAARLLAAPAEQAAPEATALDEEAACAFAWRALRSAGLQGEEAGAAKTEAEVRTPGGRRLRVLVRPLPGRAERLLVLRPARKGEAAEAPDPLLRTLTEAMREPLGSVRAAIETMTAYPEMDEAVAAQFKAIILEQSQALSAHLERALKACSHRASRQRALQAVSGAALLQALRPALQKAAGVPVETEAPPEGLHVRVDRTALALALRFLAERIENAVRCPALICRLHARRQFAVLELAWVGRPISAQRLERWAAHSFLLGDDAPARTTLQAVADHHGGEVWAHANSEGEASIRLLLPVALRPPD